MEDQTQKSDVDMFIDNLADAPIPTNALSQAKVDVPINTVNTPDPAGEIPINSVNTPASSGKPSVNTSGLSRNKMSPKQRLVEDALGLYPEKTRADLNKLKVTELKSLVDNKKLITDTARISNKSVTELEKMSPDQLKQEMGQTVNNNLQSIIQHQPIMLPVREDSRAQTLYNFHRVAAGVLECVSEADAIQQRTGSNLAGLSQQLKDNKEEFMDILKDLYREYHQDIDTYITPLTVYGVFMAEKLGAVFMENKKKISRGESVKSPLKLEKILGLDSSPC